MYPGKLIEVYIDDKWVDAIYQSPTLTGCWVKLDDDNEFLSNLKWVKSEHIREKGVSMSEASEKPIENIAMPTPGEKKPNLAESLVASIKDVLRESLKNDNHEIIDYDILIDKIVESDAFNDAVNHAVRREMEGRNFTKNVEDVVQDMDLSDEVERVIKEYDFGSELDELVNEKVEEILEEKFKPLKALLKGLMGD